MARREHQPIAVEKEDTAGSWRSLFLIGGWSAICFVVLLLVALALDIAVPPPAHGGAETLGFIASHTPMYIAQQILWLISALLAALVFTALIVAVSPAGRSLALIATVIGGMSWVLMLATSRGALALVYLADRYAEAPARDKSVFSTAAEASIAENKIPAIAGILAAAAIVLISVVMVRSVLPTTVAWLGIATGALGILSEAFRIPAPALYTVYGLLLAGWLIALGSGLLFIGRRDDRSRTENDR